MPPTELAERLVLLLALSLFLGLAFEEVYKRDEPGIPGGVRTFPLVGLGGALLYLVEPAHALAFCIGLLTLGAWLFAFLRAPRPTGQADQTLIVPAANLLVYALGPVALTQPPWLAIGAAVAAVLLIGWREQMHGLARLVPQEEVLTAGKFLILAGIILPLLPDSPMLAASPLTPYRVWLAVVAISGLSYLTYLVQRYLPLAGGALLPAMLGGLYSSTVVTVALARQERGTGVRSPDISAGIVAATAMMYPRTAIIIAFFSVPLMRVLLPALALLTVAGALLSWWEWRRLPGRSDRSLTIPAANPLQLTTALVFAVLFLVVSLATTWVHSLFGQAGTFVLAALVGASDITPFVLNLAQGGVPGLHPGAAAAAVFIAASANNLAKAAYAIGFAGWAMAARSAVMLTVLGLLGFVAAALYLA